MNTHLLNSLLDERHELIERVEYWVGDETEEMEMHKKIDALTRKIKRIERENIGGNY